MSPAATSNLPFGAPSGAPPTPAGSAGTGATRGARAPRAGAEAAAAGFARELRAAQDEGAGTEGTEAGRAETARRPGAMQGDDSLDRRAGPAAAAPMPEEPAARGWTATPSAPEGNAGGSGPGLAARPARAGAPAAEAAADPSAWAGGAAAGAAAGLAAGTGMPGLPPGSAGRAGGPEAATGRVEPRASARGATTAAAGEIADGRSERRGAGVGTGVGSAAGNTPGSGFETALKAGGVDFGATVASAASPGGARGPAEAAPGLPAGAAAAAAGLAVPAAPGPMDSSLAAAPGSTGFRAELAHHITYFVRHGIEHARLELNPAELGPVAVRIELDGHAAQVHLAAEQGLTRSALEQALPELASQLREAGFTLSGGGVSQHGARPEAGPRGDDEPGRRGASGRPPGATEATAPVRTVRGLVDLVA